MGNHACANRGDCAISRGLHQLLQQLYPNASFSWLSRHPVSSAYLSGQPYQQDRLSSFYQSAKTGLSGRLYAFVKARYFSRYLAFYVRHPMLAKWLHLPLPAIVSQEIEFIRQFDLVIQVGGSNFVDLYGCSQFDYALSTLIADRPLYLLGHSAGPFGTGPFCQLAKLVFGRAQALVLRESLSTALINTSAISVRRLLQGADTAWLVDPALWSMPAQWRLQQTKPRIAITVRSLYPFDQKLNCSQSQFEQAMLSLMNQLISSGYQLLLLSTCTGIDGYKNDDRMLALRLQHQLCSPSAAEVEMRELNDIQLGWLFSQCILTIGTRLHSAIISMNFGTPAFAINYEHKSAGILAQMQLSQQALSLEQLCNGTAQQHILAALNNLPTLIDSTAVAVAAEKQRAAQAIQAALTPESTQ
jgi:colanic acid/amylovoran biosynthesis protein